MGRKKKKVQKPGGIDKVVILGSTKAMILYTDDRGPKFIQSSEDIKTFLMWFFDNRVKITYAEYTRAVDMSVENTAVVDIKTLKVS